jgi:hypothetical protein
MTPIWITLGVLAAIIAFVVWRASKLGTVRTALEALMLLLR